VGISRAYTNANGSKTTTHKRPVTTGDADDFLEKVERLNSAVQQEIKALGQQEE